mgnify:FL=1
MKKKILILGAGPSGLSVAYGAKKNNSEIDIKVIEKKNQVGGLAGSFKSGDDFIDYGPHRLSVQNSIIKSIAESLLESNLIINKSQHGVEFNDKLYQFPPKIKDLLNIKSILIIYKLVISYISGKFHWFINRYKNENFNEYILHQFGNFFLNEIAKPMSNKVWGDSDKIDPNFVTQRFSMVKPFEIFKQFIFPSPKLNPSTFYYPKFGGFQAIWDAMSEKLKNNNVDICLNSFPTKIIIENEKIIKIQYKEDDNIKTIDTLNTSVVSTIPILNLVKIIDLKSEKLVEMAKKIRVRSMYLVVMKFNQNQTLPYRTLIFPEKKFIFNRIFEQNLYSQDSVKTDRSVIVADITYDRNDKNYEDENKILEKTTEQISKLDYIDMTNLINIELKKVEFAYVSPEIETRKNFDLIRKELEKIDNLHLLGRFGVGDYDNSDYAIINGLNLSDLLTSKITSIDYSLKKSKSTDSKIVG